MSWDRGRKALGELVEKEIKGGNPAVSGNDEISPGVIWRLTRAARYPLEPPAIAQLLGLGNWLISKVRVSSSDRARDAIDLVAATVDAFGGIVEHTIFSDDLFDSRAPTRGIVFTEDVLKIAGQQGRYGVGHDRLVLGGEVIVERNVVEIKGGKEVTVYETWPSADGQHDFQGTGRAEE
jgi:hypothetical protein